MPLRRAPYDYGMAWPLPLSAINVVPTVRVFRRRGAMRHKIDAGRRGQPAYDRYSGATTFAILGWIIPPREAENMTISVRFDARMDVWIRALGMRGASRGRVGCRIDEIAPNNQPTGRRLLNSVHQMWNEGTGNGTIRIKHDLDSPEGIATGIWSLQVGTGTFRARAGHKYLVWGYSLVEAQGWKPRHGFRSPGARTTLDATVWMRSIEYEYN